MRIVVFAKRHDADGNGEYLFDICTEAEREERTSGLSKQGYEVYSGPPQSDLPPDEKENQHARDRRDCQ